MSVLKKTSVITTFSIFLIMCILLALFTFLARQHYMEDIQSDFTYKECLINENLHNITIDLERATKFSIIDNPEIINLFVEGKREELYLRTKELYASLNKKYHGKLAVMHFYKPGVESFLRMQKPEKFGDVTKGHRPLLKEIDDKELKYPLTGFEAGRFSISYRVEVPIYLKGKYEGILDYGIEIGMMNHFISFSGNIESALILTAKRAEPLLYKKSEEISDELVIYEPSSPLFEAIKIEPKKETITFASHEGKEYALYAIPLMGHAEEEVALYVMAQDVTHIYDELAGNIIFWIIASIFIIIITMVIFRKSFMPLIKELDLQKEMLTDAQSIAKMGNWELDLNDNSIVCSKEVFAIVGMDDENPEPKQRLENMMQLIYPEDLKNFEDDLLSAIRAGTDAELVHRIINKKSGDISYMMHHCRVNKKQNSVHCTVQDVTDLILSQQAEAEAINSLKTSEKRFNSIADAVQDGILMLDENGMLTYMNPKAKEIFGYSEEELMGKDFHLMAAPKQYYEAYKKGYAEFIKSGRGAVVGKTVEISAIRKGGEEFPVSISIGGIKIEGKWHGIGVVRDITNLKKTESELKAKEEMMLMQSRQAAMGDMVEMIAHQWRQPITVMAMAANNLQLSIELDEKIEQARLEKLIETVKGQTQKLSKIISDFTKHLEHDEKMKSSKVIDILNSTMKIMEKDLEYNNIALKINNSSQSSIKIYEGELMQVFINLIKNAKEALIENRSENRKILIKIYEKEGQIITLICDNAGGIPEENLKRLAEPYFSTKGENEKGLGLYISKTIIQKHFNGHLTWLNRRDGACFAVSLPIEKP